MPTALRRNVDEIVWIPLWRLTHIHQDLISEIDERPLLTVFRFVRFSRFFVPSPGDPRKLVLQMPGIQLCGQVLTYRLANTVQLVEPSKSRNRCQAAGGYQQPDGQFATALANVQQQFTSLHPQLQAPPLVPQLLTPADSQTPGAADFDRADRHPPRARAPERRGVAYDADDDDMNEERPRSPRGYIQARGLVDRADINDHARQARGRSASPHARRGRDRSSEHHRRSRSRSRDWFPMRSDRSRSRSRSPRSHLPRGNDRFRPSSNELRVHELARVGPRQGTYDANLFSRADAQDRVRAMLQVEQFRRRYRATKVTTKMLFSVDFFTRPLDHFLQSADTTNSIEPRLVTHDSTQWNGAEQAPTHTIRRADQLHRALYAIQDAASVWYPDDLTRVFRAVHNNATHQVQPWASETVINAMCNLYSAVFASIFNSILSGTPLQLLEGLALQSMRRDSSEYQHYVGMVLNDAMLNSVFRAPGARPRERSPPRPRHGQRKPPGGTPTVIPPHIRSKIPTASGRSVCLRYQSMKDCDFPRCPHAHELVPLPGEVLKWLVDTHNSLKSDHPQS